MKYKVKKQVGNITIRQLINFCESYKNECYRCPLRDSRACSRPLEASDKELEQIIELVK